MPIDNQQPQPAARTIALDVVSATDAPADPLHPVAQPASPADGDPFNPFKILNYIDTLRQIAAGHAAQTFPVTVEIDPSNRCNHRCEWCVSIEAHTGERISVESFDKLINEVDRLGTKSIVLKGGGEPTIHPHFNDLLHNARTAGLRVGLITNGSMPHTDTPQAVLDCCDWVRISLDAATADVHHAIHGSRDFFRIVDNVTLLARQSADTLVGLNFVAEQRNYRQIRDFAQLGKSLGVGYVSFRCVFDPRHPPPQSMRQHMRSQAAAARQFEDQNFRVFLGNFSDEYLDASPDRPFPYQKCLGPNLVGVVGAEGEVYACCFLRGNKQFSFGNIHEQSFEQIWSGDRRRQVMDAVYEGRCGRVCMGGMTANRYNVYNQILNYLELEHKRHTEFV